MNFLKDAILYGPDNELRAGIGCSVLQWDSVLGFDYDALPLRGQGPKLLFYRYKKCDPATTRSHSMSGDVETKGSMLFQS